MYGHQMLNSLSATERERERERNGERDGVRRSSERARIEFHLIIELEMKIIYVLDCDTQFAYNKIETLEMVQSIAQMCVHFVCMRCERRTGNREPYSFVYILLNWFAQCLLKTVFLTRPVKQNPMQFASVHFICESVMLSQ